MSARMQVLPVDFVNGVARDSKLAAAVRMFWESEFAKEFEPTSYIKTWAVVEAMDNQDPIGYSVHAVASVAYALDCPVFHVHAEDDQDKREHARAARDMLLQRAASFIQDQFGHNTEIFVYVAPEKHRFWAAFLRLLGAKAAERYRIKV